MKKSVRAKRMQRHHQRSSQESKLSLVSLMDIFTILVFFLMVNASDVQVLQNNKDIELPESVSQETAKDNLIITINNNSVIVGGRRVAMVEDVIANDSIIIEQLNDELEYQKTKRIELTEEELANGRGINIMADKTVPYSLLKKIMQTCASAGYTNISLAVSQTGGVSDEALLNEVGATNGVEEDSTEVQQ